jgi:Uma2 family endonuclease
MTGPATTRSSAMIDALSHEKGKAEIVDGRIVRMSPAGWRHGQASIAIAMSLRTHQRRHGGGYAVGDNVGFLVNLPGRQSFSPDAAWHTKEAQGLEFAEGAPAFAVEIRSKADYAPQAEKDIAAKRAEYFAAGTLVVWDVDLLGDLVIRVYRAPTPDTVTAYRRGDVAEAEPAVPRWRFPVDELFE